MNEPYRRWRCRYCAFVYDEEHGLPEEGLAPGTRWSEVPEDWFCPQCGAEKADYDMEDVT